MSRWRTKPVRYHCTNDCRREGCPGHALVLEHCNSSDTVGVWVDGELHEVFDDDKLSALVAAAGKKYGE